MKLSPKIAVRLLHDYIVVRYLLDMALFDLQQMALDYEPKTLGDRIRRFFFGRPVSDEVVRRGAKQTLDMIQRYYSKYTNISDLEDHLREMEDV